MQRRVLVYTIVIAASVAAIAGLLHLGESWFPARTWRASVGIAGGSPPLTSLDVLPAPAPSAHHATARHHPRDADGGHVSPAALGQPAVIGEIAAGLLLGPSFLGQLWPAAAAFVFPDVVARRPAAPQSGRRHPLHVQRRPRCRRVASPAARADGDRRQPLQHRRSVPARRGGRAGPLSALCPGGRAIPLLRALHGHRAQHHRVSGARARHRGARSDANASRHDGPGLRRRRRCDGVGAAGDGRDARDGGRHRWNAGAHGVRARPSSWPSWCGR